MSPDGTCSGYDLEPLKIAREILPLPLIEKGGAGEMRHFLDVFEQADVDGALAATVFHSGQIPIPELKTWLANRGIGVRS